MYFDVWLGNIMSLFLLEETPNIVKICVVEIFQNSGNHPQWVLLAKVY